MESNLFYDEKIAEKAIGQVQLCPICGCIPGFREAVFNDNLMGKDNRFLVDLQIACQNCGHFVRLSFCWDILLYSHPDNTNEAVQNLISSWNNIESDRKVPFFVPIVIPRYTGEKRKLRPTEKSSSTLQSSLAKPCPFCSEQPILNRVVYFTGYRNTERAIVAIGCDDCKYTMWDFVYPNVFKSASEMLIEATDKLIQKWNRRVNK